MSIPDDKSHLVPTNLQRAEEAVTAWFVVARHGTTLKQVLDPDFWQHTAARMLRTPNKGIGDTIRVLAEDGSFDAEVTVVAVDPRGLWAQVRAIWICEGPDASALVERADADGYKIEWGGAHKWRIIHGGDIVDSRIPTKEEAEQKLANIKAAKKAA